MQMYTKNVYVALLDTVERVALEHRGPFYMKAQHVLQELLDKDLPFTEKQILNVVEDIERRETKYYKEVDEVHDMIKDLSPATYAIAGDIYSFLQDENLVINKDNVVGMHKSLFD